MDRDEINVIHCTYWGRKVRESVLKANKDPLISCGPDTAFAFVGSPFLRVEKDAYVLADGLAGLIKMLEGQLSRLPDTDYLFGFPFSEPIRKRGARRPAFLAISYASAFSRVKTTVKKAAADAGFNCEVTGDLSKPGNIMDQVWRGIRKAEVVVADITGFNPNVMIEVGIAASLGKEVILLSQDDTLPFDLAHWRKETYDPKDLPALRKKLVQCLGDASPRYRMDFSK